MGDNNLLAAYKMINIQLVQSNQRLKEDIKEKVDLINVLNEDLMQHRIENKTLRDLVQKLLEKFNMVTTIMGSVRDQSESIFNSIFHQHAQKEEEQQTRKSIAGLFYEKRRAERPPYVDEAAIEEHEDENLSMEDYRPAVSREEEDTNEQLGEEEEEEEERPNKSSTPVKSPLAQRLARKSRNRSIDESFETIDSNRVVKAVRKSLEYLQQRDSGRDGRPGGNEESQQEKSESRVETDTPNSTVMAPVITIDGTAVTNATTATNATATTNATTEHFSVESNTLFEASSFSSNSGVPSDQSTQSELNPTTDQSLRPVSIKRMASDSMLTTLIERENNKENSALNNDTISNAASSTPVVRKKRGRKPKPSHPHGLSARLSPVPFVSLKPLTKKNLSEHNISLGALQLSGADRKKVKIEEPDSLSEQYSTESNDSRRPRRKAAPKTLKEQGLHHKMRRT